MNELPQVYTSYISDPALFFNQVGFFVLVAWDTSLFYYWLWHNFYKPGKFYLVSPLLFPNKLFKWISTMYIRQYEKHFHIGSYESVVHLLKIFEFIHCEKTLTEKRINGDLLHFKSMPFCIVFWGAREFASLNLQH